jgi:hypothetical protein
MQHLFLGKPGRCSSKRLKRHSGYKSPSLPLNLLMFIAKTILSWVDTLFMIQLHQTYADRPATIVTLVINGQREATRITLETMDKDMIGHSFFSKPRNFTRRTTVITTGILF